MISVMVISMSCCNEASITVNQEGVRSFASALLNAQEYEIFIDDQEVGVLNGYQNHKTCAIASGPHSIYVRAYARNSATITRVYGYSQTLAVDLSAGDNKCFSCGIVKGPPARKVLILTGSLITVLLALGLGPISHIPEHTRYVLTLVMAFITLASSWYGHSSTPGKSIYLREA
jgi:hypothetical protein